MLHLSHEKDRSGLLISHKKEKRMIKPHAEIALSFDLYGILGFDLPVLMQFHDRAVSDPAQEYGDTLFFDHFREPGLATPKS